MTSPPDAVYAEVRDTDPDTIDSAGLDAYVRHVAELKAWCDARQVRAIRSQRRLADEGRATDPRNSLTNHGRQSSKDARAASEREQVCSSMPGFEDALVSGSVSAGHVDAIATAMKNLHEAEQAEFADCRMHHLRPWREGGRTDLADLAPICEPHHHLVHEGGWT